MDKNVLKLCKNTASVLGIIQAVIWFMFHLLGILYYQEVMKFTVKNSISSNDLLEAAIYKLFVDPHRNNITGLYIHPQVLFIVNCVYLVGSIIWLGCSSFLCWVSFRGKWDSAFASIISWVLITALLSIGDLVLTAFLSTDFSTFSQFGDNIFYNVAFLIIILIASRLFLLWICNVCLVIYFIRVLVKRGYEDQEKFKDGCLERNRPLEAWNEGPSLNQQPEKPEYDPREEEDFDRSFFDNSGYEPDDTISVESVSMHIRRPKRVVYPVNVPPPKLLPPKVSYTPPPYIPPPDYTPPGSPTFKRSPVYRSTTEFELLKN